LFPGSTSICTLSTIIDLCTATVAAVNDANSVNESATITIEDSNPPAQFMRPIASRTVTVTTIDND
jgi:hypothetical protein